MPADPTHPDQLGGDQRLRADLVAYLDSLPVGELAELLASGRPITAISTFPVGSLGGAVRRDDRPERCASRD
jgi:hypothetical protein